MDATLAMDVGAVQTSPFAQIDRRFFAVLFGSIFLHAVVATCVARQPHVVDADPYEAVPDRFLKSPLLPIPKFAPVKLQPPAPGQPPSPSNKPPSRPPMGNRPGGSAPALGALLSTALDELKGKSGEIDQALSGATLNGPVDTTTLASRRERGPNEAQAIGPITTSATKSVGIGEHVDVPAAKPVVDPVVIYGPDVPDVEAFMRFINARRPAFAACYEHELKYNRSLRGRVTVHLTVASDGRAREVEVEQDSLGSRAVAECVEALVKRWTFPVKPGDEVPLQFPVLFAPAQ